MRISQNGIRFLQLSKRLLKSLPKGLKKRKIYVNVVPGQIRRILDLGVSQRYQLFADKKARNDIEFFGHYTDSYYSSANFERLEFILTVTKVCQVARLSSGKHHELMANFTAREYKRQIWLLFEKR